jgi:hypothetical protein
MTLFSETVEDIKMEILDRFYLLIINYDSE